METYPTNITIGPIRLSYARVWEAEAMNEGDAKKFSTCVLIPKSDTATLAKVKAAIATAMANGKDSKFAGKVPPNLKQPLRDGDSERQDDASYVDHMFFNCSSNQRPGIVDINRNQIVNRDEVYSGCYGFINVNFYPYSSNGSKGIAVGLNHFMKTKDGEALSGGTSIEDAFADIAPTDTLL
jgi:hypothetical protein